MRRKAKPEEEMPVDEYYETHGVLTEFIDEDSDLTLEETLRETILCGKRTRRLRELSIKIDSVYFQSIKKIAAMKGIPYQSLVREWLTEKIRKELKIA